MALFKRPKPNERMPQSEDIYRNPKELEALKNRVKPEEYLKTLYDKISSVEKLVEEFEARYADTKLDLERTLGRRKLELEREISTLENVLIFKREEHAELVKPITLLSKALQEKESELLVREQLADEATQRAFEREREAEKKLESVQELADELGESRVRLTIKERTLQGREDLLKDKETQYLVRIERFSREVNESSARIQERVNEVTLKELNLQGKEENLVKREKELLDGHIWLNDQRGVLDRAWKELKKKKS